MIDFINIDNKLIIPISSIKSIYKDKAVTYCEIIIEYDDKEQKIVFDNIENRDRQFDKFVKKLIPNGEEK